jgi:exodeoxyribonuclease (lambda-induced)
MNYKIIACRQGDPEWHKNRCGAITASRYGDAISLMQRNSGLRKVGGPTAAAEEYAAEIAMERIAGAPYKETAKAWILERGHEMEDKARLRYEEDYGVIVEESGIAKSLDDWFGYSTDGIVGDKGLIEIKSPINALKVLEMFKSGDTSEYDFQMQGGMWLMNREWCDFIMYVPQLASAHKDLYVKRIFRDDKFIAAMELELYRFRRMVMDAETIFRENPDMPLKAA